MQTHDYAVLDLSPRAWRVVEWIADKWGVSPTEALERIVEAWARQEEDNHAL